jgi:hypothetical protein
MRGVYHRAGQRPDPVAYYARTEAKHLSERDCGIVSPSANRKGAGAHDYPA